MQEKFTQVDVLILMTAAVCHDLDHPGFNNTYDIPPRPLCSVLVSFSFSPLPPSSRSLHLLPLLPVLRLSVVSLASSSFFFVSSLSCCLRSFSSLSLSLRYQINARTELAVRYNDISPLENHHCAVAFQIFSQPDCNIFSNFDPEAFKQIRQGTITLILATDMARHGEILDSFKQKVDSFDYTDEEHVTCVRKLSARYLWTGSEPRGGGSVQILACLWSDVLLCYVTTTSCFLSAVKQSDIWLDLSEGRPPH